MKYLTLLFLALVLSFPVFSETGLVKKGKIFLSKILSIEEDKMVPKDKGLLPQSFWDYSKKGKLGVMEEEFEDQENNENEQENEELEEDA